VWHAMRLSGKMPSDFVSSTKELIQRTSWNLIVATGALYLVWHLVATLTWPATIGWRTWLVTPAIALICALSLFLLPKRLLLAQGVWLVGLLASVTLAIMVLQQPRIALAYTLLPLMTVVTIGWPGGLLMQLMVVATVWWLSGSGSPQQLPPGTALEVTLGGLISGVVGWAASDALLTVTQWSLYSFRSAKENMEAARSHRAQLARVLKDLDQAYHRLERANSTLVAAWKVADEAERFKAEFAANVSHELRTPLNLIVGFVEMMMTSPESYGGVSIPGVYRTDLNAIYQSAQHLLALVDDVLDLARIEVGKIPLVRQQADMAVLIRGAVDMVSDYVAAKGLELRIHVAEGLPALWIDRLRIRQVLLNLLVNAARFTKQGSITIEALRQGDEVFVRVMDTGRGIPREELPHVFEEFRSGEQTTTGWHAGSGLGLPISKKFVTLHHGRMGVESTYLQGATFWFTLPCESPEARMVEAAPLPRAKPFGHLGPEQRVIVMVHGDAETPRLLQRYLEDYRIMSAANMAEGIALARDVKAIALMAGGQRPLPALVREIPLLIYCDLPDATEAAKALGACRLLVKPVSRRELLTAIDKIGQPVRRVLIADDDPEMVRLLRRMLHGCVAAQDCLEAFGGEEALSILRADKPDLLLLDLVMPDLDGQEVLLRMKADPELCRIPVILVSAHAQDRVALEVSKPIEIWRPGGFQVGETLRVLRGILDALTPGWH